MHEHRQRGASIACQIGANAGSVSGWPSMLASTITPDGPGCEARASSGKRELGVLPGQRREPADAIGMRGLRARAMSSFMMRAALRLTSGPPQIARSGR